MKVAGVRDQLASQFDHRSSWSTVVLGITPEAAAQSLTEFNEGKVQIMSFPAALALADRFRDWPLQTELI
jgi:hypothetical protein